MKLFLFVQTRHKINTRVKLMLLWKICIVMSNHQSNKLKDFYSQLSYYLSKCINVERTIVYS